MGVITRVCTFMVAVLLFVSFQSPMARASTVESFAQAGAQAHDTLMRVFYAGAGLWRDCDRPACHSSNADWGADSATYTLFLRWRSTQDPSDRNVIAALARTASVYGEPCANAPCAAWSDTPAWDAVALMRESEVLGDDSDAVRRATAAVHYIEASGSFAGGACPAIPYQLPQPSSSHVKSLETDANLTKALLLLYRATGKTRDLDDALARYDADRRYYLDPQAPLYTVHVIDDGLSCQQVPRRFFASVNGDMIWNGIELWRLTGQQHFYDEALATAQAVDTDLSDAAGIFADVAGENDVVEPLVEAMYDLAVDEHVPFAHDWIVRNATAALNARGTDGTFPRFFDGPPQESTSIWETNGGLALEIAVAGLDPGGTANRRNVWAGQPVFRETLTTLPATITFRGSAVALVGSIGRICQREHVRVFIDNVETFDRTGLWQNYSMPLDDSVFFAWRWPQYGEHTIRLEPGDGVQTGLTVMRLDSVVSSEGS